MGLFDRLRKKSVVPPAVKAPAIASQLSGGASSNSLAAMQMGIGAGASLGDAVKGRIGLNNTKDTPTKSTQPKKGFGDRANDWIEGKIASADKFIADNTFGGKNRVFNAALGAYDKAMNLKDDFHDWKQRMADKYHSSRLGLNIEEGKNWLKNKFKSDPNKPGMMDKIKNSTFGLTMGEVKNWAKKKFASDPNKPGMMDKIRNSTFGLTMGEVKNWAKKKFASDPDKPGLKDKIKNSSFGLTMGELGKWTKGQFSKAKSKITNSTLALNLGEAKNWAKGKINKAADWIGDKKDRLVGLYDDFKDQLAAHDDERYEKHRVEKYGAEYLNQKAAYEMMLKNGDIGQNISELSDVDSLLGPENNMSFTDKIKDTISNDRENKHDSMLSKLSIGSTVGGFAAGKVAKKYLGKGFSSPISDSISATASGIKFGVHSKEHSNLKKLTDEQMTAGVDDERDKRKLGEARGNMMARLNRERVKDASAFVGSTAKAIGGALDGGLGIGAGSTVGKVIGGVASVGGGIITDSMRASEDKKIAKNAVFGNEDNYNAIKGQFGLLRGRDMRIGMSYAANARNIGDIAERARYDRAKTVNKYRGKDEAGYNMLQARGYTDKGINAMTDEDTAKELGLKQNLNRMRRRVRKNKYIG